MSQLTIKIYLGISGVIFGIVAAIHLIRAINSWSFVIGPFAIPVVVSWIGFLLTATLCFFALRIISKGILR